MINDVLLEICESNNKKLMKKMFAFALVILSIKKIVAIRFSKDFSDTPLADAQKQRVIAHHASAAEGAGNDRD